MRSSQPCEITEVRQLPPIQVLPIHSHQLNGSVLISGCFLAIVRHYKGIDGSQQSNYSIQPLYLRFVSLRDAGGKVPDTALQLDRTPECDRLILQAADQSGSGGSSDA